MAFMDDVNAKFKKLIEAGQAPWQKDWKQGEVAAPFNPVSNYQFNNFNMMQLAAENRTDPRWCTYVQCKQKGWVPKKGSKGVVVAFKQFGQDGESKKPSFIYARVFNGADIKGIPPYEKQQTNAQDACLKAEELLKKNPGFQYDPAESKQYDRLSDFYAAVFARYTYWAAEKYRQEAYGRGEGNAGKAAIVDHTKIEARAAIANYMLAAETGLGVKNNPALKQTLAETLKKDPREIFRTCHVASRVKEYITQGGEALMRKMMARRQQQEITRPPARQLAAAGMEY